tara:strand:+ start:480 stop:1073 length:594 start_codon:yes stop_codon:yes gene_type:complete
MAKEPIDLSNTAKALDLYGKEVIKRAKRNLKIRKKVDGKWRVTDNTGNLAKSLHYKLVLGKNKINIKFLSKEDYGYFMEKGVQGRESTYPSVKNYKTGMTKAKFTKKNLAKGVIEGWVRSPKFKLRDKDGKFIKKNDANIRNASFMIGKSIAEKGLGARSYMADAIDETKKRFVVALRDGLLKDLTTGLNVIQDGNN